jgi:adenylyltransferase/sulfurtransferase
MPRGEHHLTLKSGRFDRLEAIEWWDQPRVAGSKLLVVGAGALGNEVVKNLVLLGAGHVVVVDMDRVEMSNLTRSVLLRESDEGQPKASCVARAARALSPSSKVTAIHGNVHCDVGLGLFRWADVVVAALDNREARLRVNSACARVGRPWIDGGIDVLPGVVRGFFPPSTACYECTMSAVDWEQVNRRRSCSLLAREAVASGGTPTTPTSASIIGALQVQETLKILHGMEALLGQGVVFDGVAHDSYRVSYPISPECGWHEPPSRIETRRELDSSSPLSSIWAIAEGELGGLDAIELGRELVSCLECPECGGSTSVLCPAERLSQNELLCSECGEERIPTFVHAFSRDSDALRLSAAQMGLPPWDVIWGRRGEQGIGIELAGDATTVLEKDSGGLE